MENYHQNRLIIWLILIINLWGSISAVSAQQDIPLAVTAHNYELPPVGYFHTVAWSPNGNHLAISSNATILLYTADTLEPIAQFDGHAVSWVVTALEWSPNGDRLASASQDKTIRIWEVTTGDAVTVDGEFKHSITSIAWRPDGEILASASLDIISVKLINPLTGQVENTLNFTDSYGQSTASTSAAWSPDQRFLVVCGARDLQVFEVDEQGLMLGFSEIAVLGPAYIAKWSPDGSMIATDSGPTLSPSIGTYHHTFTGSIWNSTTGDLIQILEGLSSDVVALAWSPDGQFLAANSGESTTHIWEVGTWQTVAVLENGLDNTSHLFFTDTLAWSPNSRQLATVGNDNLLRIWTLEEGE